MAEQVKDLFELYDKVLNELLDEEENGKKRVSVQDIAKLVDYDPRLTAILRTLLIEHKIIAANYFQAYEQGSEGHPFLEANNYIEPHRSEFLTCADMMFWLSLLTTKTDIDTPTSAEIIFEMYAQCVKALHKNCSQCNHCFGYNFGQNMDEKLYYSIRRLKAAGFLEKLKQPNLSTDTIEQDRDIMDILTKHMKVENCYHFTYMIQKSYDSKLFAKALNYDIKVFRLPPIPLPKVLEKKRQTSNPKTEVSFIEALKKKNTDNG